MPRSVSWQRISHSDDLGVGLVVRKRRRGDSGRSFSWGRVLITHRFLLVTRISMGYGPDNDATGIAPNELTEVAPLAKP